MILSYLTMQNAIMAQNTAQAQMISASDRMLSSTVTFGNSQPLKPSFAQADKLELQNKTNETKISVLQKIINAIREKLTKEIKDSTPKYAGVNYKA